eukprot:CFRG1899T1
MLVLAYNTAASQCHSQIKIIPTLHECCHYQYYERLWDQARQGADHATGGIAAGLFKRSMLPTATLSKIWNLSDTNAQGKLDQTEFICALRLIAAAQAGMVPSLEMLSQPPPPGARAAQFQGIPGPVDASQQQQQTNPLVERTLSRQSTNPNQDVAYQSHQQIVHQQPQMQQQQPRPQSPSRRSLQSNSHMNLTIGDGPDQALDSSTWSITSEEKAASDDYFNGLNLENGEVSGLEAKNFFMRSKLPVLVLSKIWSLSDINGNGRLDAEEFAVAMRLIKDSLQQKPLPAILPLDIVPPSHRTNSHTSSTGTNSTPRATTSSGFNRTESQTGMQSQMPPLSQHAQLQPTLPPQQQQGYQSPRQSTSPLPATPQEMSIPLPTSNIRTPMPPPASDGSVPMQRGNESWIVSPEMKVSSDNYFRVLSEGKTSDTLTGQQVRPLFEKSGLPQKDLAAIWNLVDTDKQGKLDREQFALAMFLVQKTIREPGVNLPNNLPANYIPPSRKPRVTKAHQIPPVQDIHSQPQTLPPAEQQAIFATVKPISPTPGLTHVQAQSPQLMVGDVAGMPPTSLPQAILNEGSLTPPLATTSRSSVADLFSSSPQSESPSLAELEALPPPFESPSEDASVDLFASPTKTTGNAHFSANPSTNDDSFSCFTSDTKSVPSLHSMTEFSKGLSISSSLTGVGTPRQASSLPISARLSTNTIVDRKFQFDDEVQSVIGDSDMANVQNSAQNLDDSEEVQTAMRKLQEKEDEVKKTAQKAEEFGERRNVIDMKKNEIENEVAAMDDTLQIKLAELQAQEAALKSIECDISKNEKSLDDKQTELAFIDSRMEAIANNMADANNRFTKTQQQCINADTKLEEMEIDIKNKQAELDNMEANIESMDIRRNEVEVAIRNREKYLRDIENQAAMTAIRVADADSKLVEEQRKLEAMPEPKEPALEARPVLSEQSLGNVSSDDVGVFDDSINMSDTVRATSEDEYKSDGRSSDEKVLQLPNDNTSQDPHGEETQPTLESFTDPNREDHDGPSSCPQSLPSYSTSRSSSVSGDVLELPITSSQVLTDNCEPSASTVGSESDIAAQSEALTDAPILNLENDQSQSGEDQNARDTPSCQNELTEQGGNRKECGGDGLTRTDYSDTDEHEASSTAQKEEGDANEHGSRNDQDSAVFGAMEKSQSDASESATDKVNQNDSREGSPTDLDQNEFQGEAREATSHTSLGPMEVVSTENAMSDNPFGEADDEDPFAVADDDDPFGDDDDAEFLADGMADGSTHIDPFAPQSEIELEEPFGPSSTVVNDDPFTGFSKDESFPSPSIKEQTDPFAVDGLNGTLNSNYATTFPDDPFSIPNESNETGANESNHSPNRLSDSATAATASAENAFASGEASSGDSQFSASKGVAIKPEKTLSASSLKKVISIPTYDPPAYTPKAEPKVTPAPAAVPQREHNARSVERLSESAQLRLALEESQHEMTPAEREASELEAAIQASMLES